MMCQVDGQCSVSAKSSCVTRKLVEYDSSPQGFEFEICRQIPFQLFKQVPRTRNQLRVFNAHLSLASLHP